MEISVGTRCRYDEPRPINAALREVHISHNADYWRRASSYSKALYCGKISVLWRAAPSRNITGSVEVNDGWPPRSISLSSTKLSLEIQALKGTTEMWSFFVSAWIFQGSHRGGLQAVTHRGPGLSQGRVVGLVDRQLPRNCVPKVRAQAGFIQCKVSAKAVH